MATIVSQSPPPSHGDDKNQIPTATLALPSIAPATRRLPPPCWTAEETVALIDAYKDKWYSVRRGNLRANHWQEVADDVASRCPASPTKTAVQCRHKMEKLRKRYRAEIQRATAHGGVRRYSSAWAHFQNMHAMEIGPNTTPPSSSDGDESEDPNSTAAAAIKRINNLYNYNNQRGVFVNRSPPDKGSTPGFRIKIPAGNANPKLDQIVQNPNYPNPRFHNSNPISHCSGPSSKVLREGFQGRSGIGKRATNDTTTKKTGSCVGEVVAAIQALGESFTRIEKAKMDMARQIEEMRMETELKRTEMILSSQQRIVEAFANAVSERNAKKAKRVLHC